MQSFDSPLGQDLGTNATSIRSGALGVVNTFRELGGTVEPV